MSIRGCAISHQLVAVKWIVDPVNCAGRQRTRTHPRKDPARRPTHRARNTSKRLGAALEYVRGQHARPRLTACSPAPPRPTGASASLGTPRSAGCRRTTSRSVRPCTFALRAADSKRPPSGSTHTTCRPRRCPKPPLRPPAGLWRHAARSCSATSFPHDFAPRF